MNQKAIPFHELELNIKQYFTMFSVFTNCARVFTIEDCWGEDDSNTHSLSMRMLEMKLKINILLDPEMLFYSFNISIFLFL